jgi:tetratricopeptide (TPR) repeat protein
MNYPTGGSESTATDAAQSEQAPSAPVLLGIGFGVPEDDLGVGSEESTESWSELTRAARNDRQQGDFDGARDKLEKAAIRVAALPAASAERRTVLGARARIAIDFVALKRDEEANVLADQLFEEAEQAPEIGGPAFVDLAYLMATRRRAEASEAGMPDSQLPLLRLALLASESANASNERLQLAFEVSGLATAEGDHNLARSAIDRAVLDAQTVAPLDLDQLGSLKIFKARIALAQGDLVTAEASATSANRIFDEMNAPSANRAVAEATLARALAEGGQAEKARAIGTGAQARLSGDTPIEGHPARIVHSELARMEVALGDSAAARVHYESALSIPTIDFASDRVLVAELTEELAALDSPAAATAPEEAVGEEMTGETSDATP